MRVEVASNFRIVHDLASSLEIMIYPPDILATPRKEYVPRQLSLYTVPISLALSRNIRTLSQRMITSARKVPGEFNTLYQITTITIFFAPGVIELTLASM